MRNKENVKIYNQQYRKDNLEKIKAKQKQYSIDNPEKIKEYSRKSYIKNVEKIKAKQKQYRINNVEKLREYDKKWKEENREKVIEYRINTIGSTLKRKYNITLEQYNEKFNEQNGCCEICKRPQSEFKIKFAVDHDRITGENRGLLCCNCNLSIGHFHDNITTLQSAIKYLEKYLDKNKQCNSLLRMSQSLTKCFPN